MNTILKLFFGNWKRAGWTLGIGMLLGLFIRIAPEAANIALGSIFGTLGAAIQVFIYPAVLIGIVWLMIRKFFGK